MCEKLTCVKILDVDEGIHKGILERILSVFTISSERCALWKL